MNALQAEQCVERLLCELGQFVKSQENSNRILRYVFVRNYKVMRKMNRLSQMRWEEVIEKDLKKIGTSWEGVKREGLNRMR